PRCNKKCLPSLDYAADVRKSATAVARAARFTQQIGCRHQVLRVFAPATAIMTEATLLPFDLPAVRRKKLTVDFEGGNQSSDAGLLLLRQAERKVGICRRLAEVMPDRRDQSRVGHEMLELVAARAFAISCGYKDGNDLNRLRHDPLLKIAVR